MIRFMADADLNAAIANGCRVVGLLSTFCPRMTPIWRVYEIPACWLWPPRKTAFSFRTISTPCLGILAIFPRLADPARV